MALTTLPFEILQAIGFRNVLMFMTFLGALALAWLVFSQPGRRSWKFFLGLLCTIGVAVMVAMSPLRHFGTQAPTFVVRIMCLITSLTILLMLAQLFRVALLVPSGLLALVWRGPWRFLLSRACSFIIAIAGLSLGALGYWNTIRVPDVREISISIPNLAPELEGFRIVQLTDLHLGTIFDRVWMGNVVDKVNSLHPDVVAITGDTGEASPSAINDALAPINDIKAKDGIFFSLGNHESYQGLDDWVKYYQANGILLRNSHAIVTRDGAPLVLLGADDRQPDVLASLAAIPSNLKNAPRVLLSHRPATAVDNTNLGIALQLSGHTHGGLFPGVQQIIAKANKGFVSGLYSLSGLQLYVSNGTGLWTFVGIRLGVPSEITLIRLTK